MINEKHNDALDVLLIFAFGIIFHVVLFFTVLNFPRAIRIYPDELRYYDIARSLFNGDGLMIRALPSDFQKLGYSLVLMPFFAIKDVALRLRAIGLGNIFILNLSVIFAWLLAGELGLNRRTKRFIAVFTAILPEMLLFVTFMSEIVYWPLFLLFFWVWTVNERKESYFLAVVEGIICYITYLTKEIFLAAILAYIAFEIVYPFIERRKYDRKRVLRLLVFIVSFAVCYLAVKLTFFRGLGNSYTGSSYNQMDIKAIMSPYKFLFAIYAFFYYVAGILVAGLVIPFVYPFVNFRSMNETSRKVYAYIILFMVITCGVLAYTISVREDLGSVKVSIMLRYFGASFVILSMLLFSSLQNTPLLNKNALTAVVIVLMYVCLIFKGFVVNNNTDHYWLLWYLAVDMKLGIMFPPNSPAFNPSLNLDMNIASLNLPGNPQKIIYTSAIVANLMLGAAVLFFQYVYSRKGTKYAKKTYAVILLVMCCALNAASYVAVKFTYSVDREAVKEVTAISDYFTSDTEPEVLYLTHGTTPRKRFDRAGRYMDTYMERRHKFYMVNDSVFAETSTKISGAKLIDEAFREIYEGVNKIDYIIIQNDDSKGMRRLANVEKIDSLSGKHYTVYKNLKLEELSFE